MIFGNKQRILIRKLPLELLNLLVEPAILLGYQENVVICVLMWQPRRSERRSGGIDRGFKPLCSFQFRSQDLDGVVLFPQLEPLLLEHQVLLLISRL